MRRPKVWGPWFRRGESDTVLPTRRQGLPRDRTNIKSYHLVNISLESEKTSHANVKPRRKTRSKTRSSNQLSLHHSNTISFSSSLCLNVFLCFVVVRAFAFIGNFSRTTVFLSVRGRSPNVLAALSPISNAYVDYVSKRLICFPSPNWIAGLTVLMSDQDCPGGQWL